jgi:NADH dehydrogenase/NADH:ubiquinone oxidoreductase subunit G
MINLKINNIPITVEDNTTVLEAARKLNIDIPTLCYLKDINQNASCRMCVVEVTGARSLLTSCSTTVTENMEVFTDTDKVKDARKHNLELILSNHHKDCDHCNKDNDCLLQSLLEKYNIKDKYPKKDELSQ